MGKCMKKLKIAGDVAVIMELSHSPHAASIGVCTRAKLLALQRLQKTTLLPAVAPNPDASSLSFLQLRSSRRLQKPPLFRKQQLHQHQLQPTQRCRERPSPRPNSRPRVGRVDEEEKGCVGAFPKGNESEDSIDFGVEASFGMELDGGDRSTRHRAPCSLIRDSDSMKTCGSTSRRTISTETNQRVRNDMRRNIPTTQEMEEFFVCAERPQQRMFIEKYNFDVVNDLPLPGRFEWVQMVS
ncbi:hypothetical protein I3842_04G104300 [Carya illinoinensis]|uniref:Cyclin-dependent kinase inhibitor domain-containing protein n=1 Tax=Carya illinoinensis TaxID=32201 RepID=A0A922JR91_CARIL|nr:hypothetical protein I3842_04G104300 [Carya illinoinensis]